MITNRRTEPLTAHNVVEAEAGALERSLVSTMAHASPLETADRDERFMAGVRTLRVGNATVRLSERILLVLAGIVAPLGIAVVLLGYWGAANTPYLFEQVPYLISGGLLGLALVFLGAFFYFAHWMTQLVKEHRIQSAALLEAIQRLHDEVGRPAEGELLPAPDSRTPAPPTTVLVATARGTMAHRVDCVVVAGKHDLRPVTEADGLAACKLCEPDG